MSHARQYPDDLIIDAYREFKTGALSLKDLGTKYRIPTSYLSHRFTELIGKKMMDKIKTQKILSVINEREIRRPVFDDEQEMLDAVHDPDFYGGLCAGYFTPSCYPGKDRNPKQ